jgi:hypothetical protein
LQLIEEQVEHSNTIISDLLEHSREIRLELTKTDAKSLTRDALALAKIPRRIRMVDLTKKEPRVEADADETILRPRPNRAQPRAAASLVRLSVYLQALTTRKNALETDSADVDKLARTIADVPIIMGIAGEARIVMKATAARAPKRMSSTGT